MNLAPGGKEQASRMRELRVEDALLYLDQVKVEFGDRPQIYNEFLDIMKTFKTQQIDTPGVIRRVSNLFQGNRRLVLGFNTFLPEGYKIELPADGDGPPVAVFRAPGSNVAHVLSGPMAGSTQPTQPSPPGPQGRLPDEGAFRQGAGGPMRNLPLAKRRGGAAAAAGGGVPIAPLGGFDGSYSPGQGASHEMAAGGMDAMRMQGRPPANLQESTSPPLRPGGMSPQHPSPGLGPKGGLPGGRLFENGAQQQAQMQKGGEQGMSLLQPGVTAANAGGAPLEFDHAINYVTTIKRRFASEPETYKKFLEILHTYQKEQRGIKEVLDEVSVLFADHPDLLKEFTYFLPDAVQAQAKAQLDAVAKESEMRKRNEAKKAIMNQAQAVQGTAPAATRPADVDRVHIPFGATKPRDPEQEKLIIESAENGIVSFEPVRPPRKNQPNAVSMAAKMGRPTTIPHKPVVMKTPEALFFERAKAHLNRKELVWEKPSGAKRHTPHMEFIKCLHLFGAGILNKDELFLLLRSLFTQGHAPKGATVNNTIIAQDAANLLRDFEDILHSRGPYADQQMLEKDRSHYGTLRTIDFDYTGCEHPTPSYRTYPSDYPKEKFFSHPEQSPDDAEVLNFDLICAGNLARMIDAKDTYDGVRARHNMYEEALCRIEDERFEVDMAIERNAQAIRDIEPLADECMRLGKREEDDGQPIGRMQYKLKSNSLNTIAIGAVARAYGDRGDEVLQHLVQNPLIVLPIVYRRLKQKDMEWRKVRADLLSRWGSATTANYEGSMDVRCYFDRKKLEKIFEPARLVDQCKHTKKYIKSSSSDAPDAADAFHPEFAVGVNDPGAVFFEPLVAVPCKVDSLHRDAIQLVAQKLKAMPALASLEREKIGRIIAEFVVPWFGYPAHWVMEEVRESFAGHSGPSVVKFAPGQRVVTIYGEGVVNAFVDAKQGYRVRLPYGTATIVPSAILYHVPNKDVPHIRRDGVMVRDHGNQNKPVDQHNLNEKHQILFATERIYLFLRYYALLCQILSNVKNHCDTFPPSSVPSSNYHNPKQTNSVGPQKERLNYSGVLASFKKLVSQRITFKEFESFGRLVSKEKVAMIASLPSLLDRCAESLCSVAKEDALLHIYDYCQYRGCRPSLVREQCFTMAPDAFFRVQFDQTTLRFSYLPKTVEFPTAPRPGDNDIEEYTESEPAEESMEEDDPIEEFDEDRPQKRTKLR